MNILKILLSLLTLVCIGGCAKQVKMTDKLEPIIISQSDFLRDLSENDLAFLNGGALQITRDPTTNLPRMIEGKFSEKIILTAEDAILSLSSVRSIMSIGELSYSCISIDDDRNEYRVFSLKQIYSGVPVDGGEFQVITLKNGEPAAIRGAYQRVADIDTIPIVSESDAKEILKNECGAVARSVELVIFTSLENPTCLSWKYYTKAKNPLDEKIVYINAIDGKLLAEYPVAID